MKKYQNLTIKKCRVNLSYKPEAFNSVLFFLYKLGSKNDRFDVCKAWNFFSLHKVVDVSKSLEFNKRRGITYILAIFISSMKKYTH